MDKYEGRTWHFSYRSSSPEAGMYWFAAHDWFLITYRVILDIICLKEVWQREVLICTWRIGLMFSMWNTLTSSCGFSRLRNRESESWRHLNCQPRLGSEVILKGKCAVYWRLDGTWIVWAVSRCTGGGGSIWVAPPTVPSWNHIEIRSLQICIWICTRLSRLLNISRLNMPDFFNHFLQNLWTSHHFH